MREAGRRPGGGGGAWGGRGLLFLLALAFWAGCGRKPEPGAASRGSPAPAPPPTRLEDARAAFQDPLKPYPDRVAALLALRTLAPPDLMERRLLYDSLKEALWAEASRADGLSLSELEERSCLEAMSWLADFQDPGARVKMEFYLDRDTVKRKRLPEALLRGFALLLAKYPASAASREVLWSAFQDSREPASLRAAAMKALEAFFPKDLEERILQLSPAPEDRWLRDLQKTLR